MGKVLDILIVNIIIIGCCLFNYSAFTSWFFDDVAFKYGKAKTKKRKRSSHFLQRVFFTDLKKMIPKHHYLLFCINFSMAVLAILSVNIWLLTERGWVKCCAVVFICICEFTLIPASFERWYLYRGNIVRRKKRKGAKQGLRS